MNRTTTTQYHILQEGSLKEELWDWSDIKALAKAGRLSPNTLIFFTKENTWKKAEDTDLAECLEAVATSNGHDEISERKQDYKHEYEGLLCEIRTNPENLEPILHAAEIALAMGDTDTARSHYQQALDDRPYHPRVVQEAKRNLPRSLARTLRFLEKPPHVWEDPVGLLTYPLSRGPLYILIPAFVLWGLSWTVWTAIPAVIMLALWTMEAIRTTSRGVRRPPLWDNLMSDPLGIVAKPLLTAAGALAELYLPFVMIAAIVVFSGQSADSDLPAVIGNSPIMSVIVFTASLFYVPAVLILVSAHAARTRNVLNPKYVATAIRVMEGEYIAALVFVLLLMCLTWGLGTLVDLIPHAARFFYAAATTYALLAGGLVFGRLHSRFKERLDRLISRGSTDA